MNEQIAAFKERILAINNKMNELRLILRVEDRDAQIASLSARMAQEGFWNNQTRAQETVDELKKLKKIIGPWKKYNEQSTELAELIELITDEDSAAINDIDAEIRELEKVVDKLEFDRVFSDPLDDKNAIVSINAGAGGTESCDWVSMLFRMYQRWVESHGLSFNIIDILPGEEAGVKNVTFIVNGYLAYGYLKAERGVHRLVRISPFDSNKRRHTSFASVDVIAEVVDDVDIEINIKDVRIDTYRSGGAGGQHVNKTDSAVRITHIPSGIVVQCQNERSQHKNKATALKVLKARLYERKRQAEEAELKKQYGEKKEIAWGSQIRSYVLHPYSMVKDHRTGFETSNVTAVMDGDIDAFMETYLKQSIQE